MYTGLSFIALVLSSIIAVSFAAAPATGGLTITTPVDATSWKAGSRNTVVWDGDKDDLKKLGDVAIDLFTGSTIQQTFLQTLATVDATKGKAPVKIDPKLGPGGKYYFLRIHSTSPTANRSDDAFSTPFTLTHMSGKFNATVQAEISGGVASTVPNATASPAGTGKPGAAAAGNSDSQLSTAGAKPTGEASEDTSGAARMDGMAVGMVMAVGSLAGVGMLF